MHTWASFSPLFFDLLPVYKGFGDLHETGVNIAGHVELSIPEGVDERAMIFAGDLYDPSPGDPLVDCIASTDSGEESDGRVAAEDIRGMRHFGKNLYIAVLAEHAPRSHGERGIEGVNCFLHLGWAHLWHVVLLADNSRYSRGLLDFQLHPALVAVGVAQVQQVDSPASGQIVRFQHGYYLLKRHMMSSNTMADHGWHCSTDYVLTQNTFNVIRFYGDLCYTGESVMNETSVRDEEQFIITVRYEETQCRDIVREIKRQNRPASQLPQFFGFQDINPVMVCNSQGVGGLLVHSALYASFERILDRGRVIGMQMRYTCHIYQRSLEI